MISTKFKAQDKTNFVYIGLVFFIWLVAYIVSQIVFVQKLGWDEVAYMSVARGITTDGDYSARAYTIMGLLRHGYPTHLINYPIFSFYLALFFKLFGINLKAAYFASWVAALGVCLFIYFTYLLLSEKDYKGAFIASIFYLIFPGVIKNCDSAMMEQAGCFLIIFSTYFIFKDYFKGVFNYLTAVKISIFFLILWLYKTLFIGIFLGTFVFICLAYSEKLSGKKIKTNLPLPLFVLLSYGLFVVLFFIVKKFIFLPLAPMMTFSPYQEFNQIYADFMGGYFNNFPENLLRNLHYFFTMIVAPYFVYPASFLQYTGEILSTPSLFVSLGIFIFLLLIMLLLTVANWEKLSPIARIFLGFSLISILSFNVIFNFLLMSFHSNIWRYNFYYLPIFICALGITLKSCFVYFKPFISDHPRISKALFSLLMLFGYFPLFLTTIVHYVHLEDWYHTTAKKNAELVRYVIKDTHPDFVYFNAGTHTTFVDYPVKQIFKDATNEQFLEINKILPSPVEYIFLRSPDWLFKNNQELIMKGLPILDGQYKLYGFDKDSQVVVYRLASKM